MYCYQNKNIAMFAGLFAALTSVTPAYAQEIAIPEPIAPVSPACEPTPAAPAEAPAPALSLSLETGVYSGYFVRGLSMYSAKLSPSAQSTISIGGSLGIGKLTLTGWNATALQRDEGAYRSEMDLIIDYNVPIGDNFSVSVGSANYIWPFDKIPKDGTLDAYTGIDSSEFYAILNGSLPWFNASVAVYVDPIYLHTTYASLTLSNSWELAPSLTLNAGLAGAAMSMIDLPLFFSDVTANAGITWQVNDSFYVAARGIGTYLAAPAPLFPESVDTPFNRTSVAGGLFTGFSL